MFNKRQIIMAFTMLFVLRIFTLTTVIVSESMEPTFQVGDYVVYYKTDDVKVGDVILFNVRGASAPFTKRVIANTAGDEIFVGKQEVAVNNILCNQPWGQQRQGVLGTWTIGEHELFVMGDNRAESMDSRVFGAVRNEDVLGRVVLHIPTGRLLGGEVD